MEEIGHLPPGFRFDPTDEELVVHFLQRRAYSLPCYPNIIPDLPLSDFDPLELMNNGNKALVSYNKWYFYSQMTSRGGTDDGVITKNGFWKEVGVVEDISTDAAARKKVGSKKYLVFFYVGHDGELSPGGIRSNWALEVYQLCNQFQTRRGRKQPDVNQWVLCRAQEVNNSGSDHLYPEGLSSTDEACLSIDDDSEEITFPH
uniref:NAC domain-containing protein n=1 Tax=Tamarix hispida TaxID=189793 RepID=I6YDS7_9CARY|nr:NAC domain-containing protein [Tamarix hispida]